MTSLDLSGGRVWTIAHRGASSERRENTRSAFDEALVQGCDAIELDLQLTRDGVVVVFHDQTLEKIGGERRRVRDLDHGQLVRLDGEIPTLADVLERYARRTRLLLELKVDAAREASNALVRATVDLIADQGVGDRVFVLCYELAALDELRRRDGSLRRVLNVSRDTTASMADPAKIESLFAVSVDVDALEATELKPLRRSALPRFVFTCNHALDVDRAVKFGATGVMSDRPGWLRGYLRSVSAISGDRGVEQG